MASDNIQVADSTVAQLRSVLVSEQSPLAKRFRALFSLKHLASQNPPTTQTVPSIDAIAAAFASPSALLKHELAYCLGQSKRVEAIPYLRKVLENGLENEMCRHEAAEALGALGDQGSVDLMRKYATDPSIPEIIRETCEIAVARLEWEASKAKGEKLRRSDFASIDPAPPLPGADTAFSIPELRKLLVDESLPLFNRYRVMFTLRDLASPPDLPTAVAAVEALAEGFTASSALFRHEIAFVFGQLSHPASIPALSTALKNTAEVGMVRHEAAEALGGLGDEQGVEDLLRDYVNDPEQVVRESCVVALDMAEYEKSGQAEYAIIPQANSVEVTA